MEEWAPEVRAREAETEGCPPPDGLRAQGEVDRGGGGGWRRERTPGGGPREGWGRAEEQGARSGDGGIGRGAAGRGRGYLSRLSSCRRLQGDHAGPPRARAGAAPSEAITCPLGPQPLPGTPSCSRPKLRRKQL